MACTRPILTLCLALGCLYLVGCVRVASEGPNGVTPSSVTSPATTPQAADGGKVLFGTAGDDVIDAQDPGSVGGAGRDEISCGPGHDEVLMDADDKEKPRDCEMAGVGSS